MPKNKTKKALTKRFRVTPKGKVMHSCAGKSHLQSTKPSNRRRRLRKKTTMSKRDAQKARNIMS